jgi:hypothetical protein
MSHLYPAGMHYLKGLKITVLANDLVFCKSQAPGINSKIKVKSVLFPIVKKVSNPEVLPYK